MTLIKSQMNIKQLKFDTLNSVFWERKKAADIVNGFLLCQVPYVSKHEWQEKGGNENDDNEYVIGKMGKIKVS